MWGEFKARLTDDARYWYKKWSSWLAIVWGVISTVFWNAPTWLPQLLNSLPPETRAMMSPLVLGVMSALPILIVHLRQRNL